MMKRGAHMIGPSPIRFGVFELDLRTRELRKHGTRVRLQDQPFQVLELLLERPGELITREEIHRRIWGDATFVDFDQSLNRAVNRIREALGDSAGTPRYVETLARRGYRFIAPVESTPEPQPEPGRSAQAAPPLAAARGSYWRRFVWLGATLLTVAASVFWLLHDRRALPSPHVAPLTTYSGVETFPAFSPDGNQVAFTWDGEKHNNPDIYVKVVGDHAALRLTSDPAADSYPAWSPDGRQIAFESERGAGGIYLVSPLGGPQRKVSDLSTNSRMCWSPDGKYLFVAQAYSEAPTAGDEGAVFLVSVEGGAPRRVLAPPPGTWYRDPTLSPDGRLLIVVTCTGSATGPGCSLQAVGLKGGLSTTDKPREIAKSLDLIYGLTWTADGSSLVYSDFIGGSSFFLWRVNLKGRSEPERLDLAGAGALWPAVDSKSGRLAFSRVLTNPDIWRLEPGVKPAPLLTSTAFDHSPQYSPDGRRVAFTSSRYAHEAIWIASADGTGATQISNPMHLYSGTPRWSPDGRRLAFDSLEKDKGWDIWVVEADGGGERQLTQGPANNSIPSWSHDGRSIYFASKRSGRFEIWRIPASGGDAVRVTRNGGYTAFDSPDGMTIYYTLSAGGEEGLYAKRLPDGEERQVVKEGIAQRGFAIFADGVYYLHARGQARGEILPVPGIFSPSARREYEIRFRDFASGRTQVAAQIEGPLWVGFTVSPDRRAFLFTKSVPELDLMLIEDLR